MQMQLTATIAPLKNSNFEIVIFISNTENGFAKAVLFVPKVSIENSFSPLENLLLWTYRMRVFSLACLLAH